MAAFTFYGEKKQHFGALQIFALLHVHCIIMIHDQTKHFLNKRNINCDKFYPSYKQK